MPELRVEELLEKIGSPVEVIGNASGVAISRVAPIDDADGSALVWLSPDHPSRDRLLRETRARVIVTASGPWVAPAAAGGKVLLVVEDPKRVYLQLVVAFFDDPRPAPGIHPTARIDPAAEIAADASIGAHVTIGRATIGSGTVIEENVVVRNRTTIGSNVTIGPGCVIGDPGLTLVREDDGRLVQLPHIGGVVIGDDVTIQALAVVDRGTLGNTVVGRGTIINSFAYVSHNCRVGEHNLIIGHTLLCGSVVTGDRCYFGACSSVRDGFRVGNDVFVGMGAVVVNDLPDGARVMGVPARPIDDVKAAQRAARGQGGTPGEAGASGE